MNSRVLFDIFTELQRRNFSLGLVEYLSGLKALAKGFGTGSRQELLFTCQLLWAKSVEEQEQVTEVLEALLPRKFSDQELEFLALLEAQTDSAGGGAKPDTEEKDNKASSETASSAPDEDNTKDLTGQESSPAKEATSVQQSLAESSLRFSLGRASTSVIVGLPEAQNDKSNPAFDFTLNLPITRRQIKRSWGYYRRMQRLGLPTELDINATLEHLHRHGVLLRPVLIPPRRNLARMLILVDVSSSMTPFKYMLQPLLDLARQSGLNKIEIYFFRNLPDHYLFREAWLSQAEEFSSVVAPFEGAGVLIISDAGAARGRLNEVRVKQTGEFLEALKPFSPHLAWLNPIPPFRWPGSNAEAIRCRYNLTMLPLTPDGLDRAVNILRGRGR